MQPVITTITKTLLLCLILVCSAWWVEVHNHPWVGQARGRCGDSWHHWPCSGEPSTFLIISMLSMCSCGQCSRLSLWEFLQEGKKNLKFTCFKKIGSELAIYYVKLKIDLNQWNLPHACNLSLFSFSLYKMSEKYLWKQNYCFTYIGNDDVIYHHIKLETKT
jgi:hypothetical protein